MGIRRVERLSEMKAIIHLIAICIVCGALIAGDRPSVRYAGKTLGEEIGQHYFEPYQPKTKTR